MSSLEKNLYKNLKIQPQNVVVRPIESRTYRGISTTDPDTKEYKLFDIGLIKQDIVNHRPYKVVNGKQ